MSAAVALAILSLPLYFMADASRMRRDLAEMLKAKGLDDAGVESMLGLVDEQSEKLRAKDAERDDALGLLVYEALRAHDVGVTPRWAHISTAEKAPYIAAARAVESKLEDELEEANDAS